jgi:plastocyanin
MMWQRLCNQAVMAARMGIVCLQTIHQISPPPPPPPHSEPTANVTEAKINTRSSDSNGGSITTTVSIVQAALNPNREQFYDPSPVTVKSGSTIRWVNEDSAPHTATSGSPEGGPSSDLDTGIIGPGQSVDKVMLLSKGILEYYCTLHPYMKGTINIE